MNLLNHHRFLRETKNGIQTLKSEPELQGIIEILLTEKCEALGIDVTREGDTGRGLVDFKFSWGGDSKVFLEVKRFDHPKLQHGLEIQLPVYMVAQKVQYGIFVPIAIDPSTYEAKCGRLKEVIEQINNQEKLQIALIDIRAWKPDSASTALSVDDSGRYEPVDMN